MERCADMVIAIEESGVGRDKTAAPLDLPSLEASVVSLFDRLLFFVQPVIEYALGVHIGFAIGWLLGLWAGKTWVEYFEPVCMDGLSELFYWRLLPYNIAKSGAVIGVGMGIIMVAIIRKRIGLKERLVTGNHNKH
jgi:hypothetical protein